jgi:hypothetical protein
MSHSPGPWTVESWEDVCPTPAKAKTDARVTAAAPELLKALKRIMDELYDDGEVSAEAQGGAVVLLNELGHWE